MGASGAAADLAWAGENVILGHRHGVREVGGLSRAGADRHQRRGTALYLAPTKALAADQLSLVQVGSGPNLGPPLRAGRGRLRHPLHQRAWARKYATYLLTTPDMLHYGLLPQHQRWSGFLRRLRYVIVDECHGYRGVFGSHVAQVLRRLRRVAAYHQGPRDRAVPPEAAGRRRQFMLASATISEPA